MPALDPATLVSQMMTLPLARSLSIILMCMLALIAITLVGALLANDVNTASSTVAAMTGTCGLPPCETVA